MLPNLFFLLLSLHFHFSQSLSTVSISQISGDRTLLICAITQQSLLNCAAYPAAAGIRIPGNAHENSSYSAVAGGKGFVCGLKLASNSSISVMVCWRFHSSGGAPRFKRIYHGPALIQLKSGDSHLCGIVTGTNQIKCWQWAGFSSIFTSLDAMTFSDVAVGDDFFCGLGKSGMITCRGSNTKATTRIPTGTYAAIEAGASFACVLSSGGKLSCWGDAATAAPNGTFTAMALGRNRGCAISRNETVSCWGDDGFSTPAAITGESFIAIEAKGGVFCGILSSNYSLLCWGSETLSGNFRAFERVLPGPCSNSCPCGPITNAEFCKGGQSICQTCVGSGSEVPQSRSGPTSERRSRWNTRMIIFLVVGIVGCTSFLVSVALWFLVVRRGEGRGSSRVHNSGRLEGGDPSLEGSPRVPVLEKRLSRIVSMGSIEEFELRVLLQATNNFSQDHKVGSGSYGSVYKAELGDGRVVAVKRAEIPTSLVGTSKRNEEQDTAFSAELAFLSKLNHKNLVRLLGFYEDSNERVLVYDYMTNGTLHDHLHKLGPTGSPLEGWSGRLKVALDAARGIEYLHIYAVPPVIHRDIKPSNILLDENWTAKVSDFGLSLLGPSDEDTHLSLLAAGTLGYIDPEYYRRHQLTSKSDVYSLGVVILELLTGYKAIHLNENGSPRNVVDFVVPYINRDEIHRVLDPKMSPPTPIEIEAVAYVAQLAGDCVSLQSRDRPPVTEIVGGLEKAWRMACSAPTTTYSFRSTNSSHIED